MKDRSLIDLQDYEMVVEPSESPENVPPADKERAPHPERSIKELLDQNREEDPFQHAAKVAVKLSLPFAIAWATFIALVTSLRNRETGRESDERLLRQIAERNQYVLDSYNQRLRWVDDKLPGYMESYKTDASKTFRASRSAAEKVFNEKPYIPLLIALVRGFRFFAIYLLLQLIFPRLRRSVRFKVAFCVLIWLPIWPAVAWASRSRKRRRVSHDERCWIGHHCHAW